MNVYFLVILCDSVYNDILRSLFFTTLEVVASPIHLKIKYLKNTRKLVVVSADLHMARLIHEFVLE